MPGKGGTVFLVSSDGRQGIVRWEEDVEAYRRAPWEVPCGWRVLEEEVESSGPVTSLVWVDEFAEFDQSSWDLLKGRTTLAAKERGI